MDGHYAGVFVFDPKDDFVLCVSDSKHPNELKMAGGMSVEGETPEQTARREATEELRTQILAGTRVCTETINGRNGTHVRHFFLAERISGALEKGATWEVEEKDADGKVVEKLTARWVPLREFAEKLFLKQHPAFGAILVKLACQSAKFCAEYEDLLQRFPEPKNRGLD